jgi:hypothetical protein
MVVAQYPRGKKIVGGGAGSNSLIVNELNAFCANVYPMALGFAVCRIERHIFLLFLSLISFLLL